MAVSFGPGKNLSQGYGFLANVVLEGALHICERTRTRTGRLLLEITLWCTHIYIYIRGPPAKSQKMPKLPPSETTKCKEGISRSACLFSIHKSQHSSCSITCIHAWCLDMFPWFLGPPSPCYSIGSVQPDQPWQLPPSPPSCPNSGRCLEDSNGAPTKNATSFSS